MLTRSAKSAKSAESAKSAKYSKGDFSWLRCEYTRDLIEDGYRAVELVGPNAWNELKNHDPTKSFMWETHGPIWECIMAKMKIEHSGSTYGFTMRDLEEIAKDGWNAYVNLRLEKYKAEDAA
jgi:hypothetical protein